MRRVFTQMRRNCRGGVESPGQPPPRGKLQASTAPVPCREPAVQFKNDRWLDVASPPTNVAAVRREHLTWSEHGTLRPCKVPGRAAILFRFADSS